MSHHIPSPPTSPAERKRKRSVTPSSSEQPLYSRKQVKLDSTLLERYLVGGGSPNVRDAQRGFSLLCWACYSKSETALYLLLRQDALDINTGHGPDRSTALHIAAAVGFSKGIESLLSIRHINVNAVDAHGQTALHRAVMSNQPESVAVLLKRGGASVSVQDKHGRLALHVAALYRRGECVRAILPYVENRRLLHTACTVAEKRSVVEESVVGGCASILQQLVKKEEEEEEEEGKKRNNKLIALCVFWNRLECLEVLLGAGYDAKAPLAEADPTDTPLYRAVQQRKLDMVRCLLRAKASPCLSNGSNPSLLYAAAHGFMEMVPLLLTRDTSQDCIRQAAVLAEPLGLAEALLRITRNKIY